MSEASPLLPQDKPNFEGLSYFPYDSTLVFRLRLRPELVRDTILMTTSTGELRRLIPFGTFRFDADGRGHVLSVFKTVDDPTSDHLFLPFRDLTSSHSTYGGGRYIDMDLDSTGIYTLDFNRAYHPYCVYNPSYSCPIPPPENRLNLAVTAGERLTEQLRRGPQLPGGVTTGY
ncbi:MAG: DUF1684 domain-containing protein [Rubricoccaceae bacterium]|nr:DUF1684 domain-containing protein [Rubricoccaceae bacterium]